MRAEYLTLVLYRNRTRDISPRPIPEKEMMNKTEGERMPLDRDEESGRYTQTYTTEMALEALDAYGGAATTSEVAEVMECSRRLALRRLRELEEEGSVSPRETGNTYLWMADDE
jgi:hypothetical protein